MTNDAKLGMLAGVLGVIVAAVLLSNAPPRGTQSQPDASIQPASQVKPGFAGGAGGIPGDGSRASTEKPTPTPAVAGVKPAALPSSPVARTRKDVDAQPTSRSSGADEEP